MKFSLLGKLSYFCAVFTVLICFNNLLSDVAISKQIPTLFDQLQTGSKRTQQNKISNKFRGKIRKSDFDHKAANLFSWILNLNILDEIQKPTEGPNIESVLRHIKVMQEIKARTRANEQKAMEGYAADIFNPKNVKQTAATALFKVDKLESKIRKVFHIENYKEIINSIISKEKKHYYTAYPFYHAQSGDYRVLQDLYGKLYEFFEISGELKNFTFLRYKGSQFDTYTKVSEFLRNELKERGIINDNVQDTRTFILSVNLSPFGNPSIAGEATWYYFENSLSWLKPNTDMIKGILENFNCSPKFVDRIVDLSKMIQTKEGSLFQIFIPKNKVNDHVYLSWRQGIPVDKELLKELFEVTHPFVPATKINDVLGKYQGEWSTKMAQDPKIQALFKDAIERINSGQVKISDVLEQYSSNPQSLKDIAHLQARILLSNDMLLNPNSGVVIYRYTTIAPETLKQYQAKLQLLVDDIIADWIENNVANKDGIENRSRAEKLFALIAPKN